MGSEALPLHNNGIFKNLPTFSPEIQGLTAIVTGANGISGFFTMRVLLENPNRWRKIWTLSRSPPPKEMMDLLRPEQRDRVEHIKVDFLGKPEDIADALKAKGVTADAVFFYSYLQPKTTIKGSHPWANAQELADVNCRSFPVSGDPDLAVLKLTSPCSGSPRKSARCVTIGEHQTKTFSAADRSEELQCKQLEATLRVSIPLTRPRSTKVQQERHSSSLILVAPLSPTSTIHKRTSSSHTARPMEQTGTSSAQPGSSVQFPTPQ